MARQGTNRLLLGIGGVVVAIAATTGIFTAASLYIYRSDTPSPLPFYFGGVLELAAATALFLWLWRSRDRRLDEVAPREEIHRHFGLAAWLLVYLYAVLWTANLFAQQDTSWYQTVVGDSEFVPLQTVILFLAMPAYLLFGGGAWLYAKTRLPAFGRGFSLPFLVAVAGPFAFQPIRADWLDEAFALGSEIYIALYWAILIAWVTVGLGGILLKMGGRMTRLVGMAAIRARERPE
jgi:methane/ammonia monooxygenase subunit C